jgi:uncharacterized membrane protein YhaH (DUF805 family)
MLGRIGRKYFWIGFLGLLVLLALLLGAFAPMMRTTGASGGEKAFLLLMQLVTFCYLGWLIIMRLHDLNRTGWWFLLLGPLPIAVVTNINQVYHYIPQSYEAQQRVLPWISAAETLSFALLFGGLIVLGCVRGTRGANRFGPGPAVAADEAD